MKAIICGGGQVGSSIARELASERVDVTVIDQSPELIRRIRDTLDVTTMVGFASHPDVLEAAGARDADMIVAVTFADEVNMIACQVAHSLFDVPMKIARVRSQAYRNPIWADLFSRDHMPIDVIISPEIEVARAISRRFTVPGSFEMIPLANDRLRLIGVRCEEECPILNTPLRQLTTLFPDLRLSIVGIIREGKPMVPSGDDHLEPGDEVYIIIDAEHVPRAMAAFGHREQEARRVIIIGGGNIGQSLAGTSRRDSPESRPGSSSSTRSEPKKRRMRSPKPQSFMVMRSTPIFWPRRASARPARWWQSPTMTR